MATKTNENFGTLEALPLVWQITKVVNLGLNVDAIAVDTGGGVGPGIAKLRHSRWTQLVLWKVEDLRMWGVPTFKRGGDCGIFRKVDGRGDLFQNFSVISML